MIALYWQIRKQWSTPSSQKHAKSAIICTISTICLGIYTCYTGNAVVAWIGGANMMTAIYEWSTYLDRVSADVKAELAYRSIGKDG